MHNESCLNRTALGSTCVFEIDRWFVYTGKINNYQNSYIGPFFKIWFIQDSGLKEFGLDRFHYTNTIYCLFEFSNVPLVCIIDDASIEDKLLSVTNSDEIAGTVAFENSSKLVFKSVVYVLVDCVPSLDNIPDIFVDAVSVLSAALVPETVLVL